MFSVSRFARKTYLPKDVWGLGDLPQEGLEFDVYNPGIWEVVLLASNANLNSDFPVLLFLKGPACVCTENRRGVAVAGLSSVFVS